MGGVRTALYNYLFAKQNGGDFIIRIEDTDSQRFVPGAEKYIIEALNWCGIIPDEGVDAEGNVVETASERHPHAPYRQSQRKPIYRQYAEQLVADGFAYYAFDTAEELGAKRAEMEASGQTFIYGQTSQFSFNAGVGVEAAAGVTHRLDHPLQDAGEQSREDGRPYPRSCGGQHIHS